MAPDLQPALGFVALLTTALTAGCAGALVQVVRLLAVMIKRDLPAADYPPRATGKFAAVVSGQGVVVLVSIAAAGVLVAIVVAAFAS
ncbi:hypothetical protein ASG90_01040 [Nocardioides sp. Soil797]|nr:hypothetical protein ASG90_01040 [Nocardioides sp. Soil797]